MPFLKYDSDNKLFALGCNNFVSLRISAWLYNSILTVSTSTIIIKETICVPTSQVLGNWYYECLWMSPWGTPDWATLKKNLFINNEALRATSLETHTKLPVSSRPDLYRWCSWMEPWLFLPLPHVLYQPLSAGTHSPPTGLLLLSQNFIPQFSTCFIYPGLTYLCGLFVKSLNDIKKLVIVAY